MGVAVVFIIVVAVGAATLLISKFFPVVAARKRQFFLRRKFVDLSPLSGQEANKALKRQLDWLERKFPGRSKEWYLEKAVYDLERDRF